jgi:ubiquinone biosynthesis protein UbiJ
MPKRIITDQTLPTALSLLHGWQGKLTWELYAQVLGQRLKQRIAKRSLYKHDDIVEVYHQTQERLQQLSEAEPKGSNATVDMLLREVEAKDAEIDHLKQKVKNLQEAIMRLERNMYMFPGMDLKKLHELLTKPLPDERKT